MSEIKTYFGKRPQPWQKSYGLSGRVLEINEDILTITCDRCRQFKKETKRFKIHPDGAITFHFRCENCMWSFSIYRNSIAEYQKTEKTLLTLRGKGNQ